MNFYYNVTKELNGLFKKYYQDLTHKKKKFLKNQNNLQKYMINLKELKKYIKHQDFLWNYC